MSGIVKRTVSILLSLMLTAGIWMPAASAEESPVTVHIIGDSTACDYQDSLYPRMGWGMVIDRFLEDNVFINNKAVSGSSARSHYNGLHNTSATVKWSTNVLPSIKEGDYVLISFGHNDKNSDNRFSDPFGSSAQAQPQSGDYDKGSKTGGGSFKWYITQFVADTKAKGATPILITSTVRRMLASMPGVLCPEEVNLRPYLTAIEEVAREQNVTFVDINTPMREQVLAYGGEDSERLFMMLDAGDYDNYPDGSEDNVHLQEYGAVEVARLIAESILNSNSPLKNRLKGISAPAVYNDEQHAVKNIRTAGDGFNVRLQAANREEQDKNVSIVSAFYTEDNALISADIGSVESIRAGTVTSLEKRVTPPAGISEWNLRIFVWERNLSAIGGTAEYQCFSMQNLIEEDFERFQGNQALFTKPSINYPGARLTPVSVDYAVHGNSPIIIEDKSDVTGGSKAVLFDTEATAGMTFDFAEGIDFTDTQGEDFVFELSFYKPAGNAPRCTILFSDGDGNEVFRISCNNFGYTVPGTNGGSVMTAYNTKAFQNLKVVFKKSENKVLFYVDGGIATLYEDKEIGGISYSKGDEVPMYRIAGRNVIKKVTISRHQRTGNPTPFWLDNIKAYLSS